MSVPANVTLRFVGAGEINVASGQTLTINGYIEGPNKQLFTGLGSVAVGSSGVIKQVWFDGSTQKHQMANLSLGVGGLPTNARIHAMGGTANDGIIKANNTAAALESIFRAENNTGNQTDLKQYGTSHGTFPGAGAIQSTNDFLFIIGASTEKARIKSSNGFMGINCNPQYMLEVQASANSTSPIVATNAANTRIGAFHTNGSGSGEMYLYNSSGSARAAIIGSGSGNSYILDNFFGVGTTPTVDLHVKGDTSAEIRLETTGASTDCRIGMIQSNQQVDQVISGTNGFFRLDDITGGGTKFAIDMPNNKFGFGKTAGSDVYGFNMATEDLGINDAGSTSATEQDWIEVTVGGNTGYIRVFATK